MKHIFRFCLMALVWVTVGCSDDNDSGLNLGSEVAITSFSLNGIEGKIDQVNETIVVQVMEGTDVTSMTPQYTLTEGAVADLPAGRPVDFTLPVSVKVVNGDVYRSYTVSVITGSASLGSFVINGMYEGVIDHQAKTVTVYVPGSVNVSELTAVYTAGEATVTPASGLVLDFTQPVDYEVTFGGKTEIYKVIVIPMSGTAYAFVGTAGTVAELDSPEEKAAAEWMLQNIEGAEYISFDDVKSGKADLSQFAVVWWHWHVDNYNNDVALPAAAEADIPFFRSYYEAGGNLLLTRYATRYLASLEIPLDKRAPNNCWGGNESTPEIAGSPWGISFKGHEDHPIFSNLQTADRSDVAYLFDAGYAVTNSTAQWFIVDWGGYGSLWGWENQTGGVALARSDGEADNDNGPVVIAEFPSRNNSGKVIAIGSGAYDWYGNGTTTQGNYRSNLTTLTKNAIEYLSE